MDENAFCCICGGNSDEDHHIFPVHLGGNIKGPTIGLCGSHHAEIHQAANNIIKNKPHGMSVEYFRRAKPIVMKIVQAMLAAEQRDLSNVPSRIVLKVPRHKLKQIHRRKMDLGFSSLEQYFGYLVNKDLPP